MPVSWRIDRLLILMVALALAGAVPAAFAQQQQQEAPKRQNQKPPAKPPVQRPYAVTFSLNATNILNRTNKSVPVGNMSSPFFLESPSGSSQFSFGPGGSSAGNRIISLRARLSF